ncbi:MAG: acyl carrier protein [Firmicutes bacterium]|nr:acyl carrier protein [Candidatus Colimorpha enterica]
MYEKIIEIISGQLNVDVSDISEDTKIMEDLGADSLDVVEMLITLEDEFGVVIPDDDIEKLVTVGDVFDYIASGSEK